jgi:glycosyltransferase involved in cell wall biosynthesis
MVGRLGDRWMRHFAAMDSALQQQPRYQGFLAASEEVGIPLALAAVARRDPRPVSIITHGSFFASKRFAWVMRALRRRSSVSFIPLSHSIGQRLREQFGVPAYRVTPAGYATDTRFFRPRPQCTDPRLVVGVGTANRDYQLLADAVLELDANIEIAADSAWYRSNVAVEAAESEAHRLRLGSYDYCALRDLYARAAVVAVPMHRGLHACGYSAIAEAMAMGKPVVATRTDCPSDFIEHGVSGFYVPPGDVAAMRNRVAQLLGEPALAARMGAAAAERMQRFGVEGYAARIASAVPGLS